MSNFIEVMAIVEGKTEQVFIEQVLQPYLAQKQIYLFATQVSKKGQKGGDVRFERVKNDLGVHLKQRSETYVTTFVDYYGTFDWPGLGEISPQATPEQIARTINRATKNRVVELFAEQQAQSRFIPYIAIHEFEALLFSDEQILAKVLGISADQVHAVIDASGEPEAINNSPETAPSKRLDGWSSRGKFQKTSTGIAIAKEIGIEKMRQHCGQFNHWLERLEALVSQ